MDINDSQQWSEREGSGGSGPIRLPARSRLNLTPRYNPRQTYRNVIPVRSRRGISASNTTRRRTPEGRPFTKNVILVSSDELSVPRGRRRHELHQLGAIVNLADFRTNWDESEMRLRIRNMFAAILTDENPHPL